MKAFFSRFLKDESGATAIEYGLIAAILSVGIISTLTVMKSNLNTAYSKVAMNLS